MQNIILTEDDFHDTQGIFSLAETASHFAKEHVALLIVLDYVKATDWPWKGTPLLNKPIPVPLVWALFDVSESGNLRMSWDIHPMKCFPTLYNRCNSHAAVSTAPILRYGGATLGGCSRTFAMIGKRRYEVTSLTPEYCSTFGLPDDCFEPGFEERMLEALSRPRNLTIWAFERTEYLTDWVETRVSLHYMKGDFLPSQRFIYVDTAQHFLTSLFSSKQLEPLAAEPWYTDGSELIDELNLNNEYCYRYEEKALFFIRKRMVDEFARQALLLSKKNFFLPFAACQVPSLEPGKKADAESALRSLQVEIKRNRGVSISTMLAGLRSQIDFARMASRHFMVMDIEYVHVTYPTGRKGSFNFPCVFAGVAWKGRKEGVELVTNVFPIPCHSCNSPCAVFNKNSLDFKCLPLGFEFIESQESLLEEFFTRYEGFKIYTYGRSDIFQLEQATNFFSDSFESRLYVRRNRKRARRIVDLCEDLAVAETPLSKIEDEVLKNWIPSWSRGQPKVSFNARFMKRFGDPKWETHYAEAIHSCISDAESAFLYLLYMKYRRTFSGKGPFVG